MCLFSMCKQSSRAVLRDNDIKDIVLFKHSSALQRRIVNALPRKHKTSVWKRFKMDHELTLLKNAKA